MFSKWTAMLSALLFLLPVAARSDDATATLSGKVLTDSGAPIAGANVLATGPSHASTQSDSAGRFSFTLAPGLYRVDVNKGGYSPVSLDNVALLAGGTQTVTVNLTTIDLSSLRTIGHVSVTASGSINTGAASTAFVGSQEIQDLANPQVNDIVQRIPGASIERGSASPNTSISLGGSQPYETQVLLDGHPLSAGRYGTVFSQFINSYLLDGIETQLGPGNTTAFAGTAVGGTANFVTQTFSSAPQLSFMSGIDSYGSQYSNFLARGTYGKFAYVLDGTSGGLNGPFNGRQGCVLAANDKATWNTAASAGIITYCGNLGSAFGARGELAKVRYSFSNATEVDLGFIGSQSTYIPQATSYGVDGGNVPIAGCLGAVGSQACTSPYEQQYVGTDHQGYFFYPGSTVANSTPIFEAQVRTTIGDNTLLFRPYQGTISRVIDGQDEDLYPQFWYPSTQAPKYCTGAPNYGEVGPSAGGYTACMGSPYSTYEHDILKGSTLSFVHPFGEDEITATYDYHSDNTYAEAGGDVQVPAGTIERYQTVSLTGDLAMTRDLDAKFGLYYTNWQLNGLTTTPPSTTYVPLTTTDVRVDPHLAFTWHPRTGLSYRLAMGTSTTFPYAGIVSGGGSIIKASGTGYAVPTLSLKNPELNPERATEFDIGADKRLGGGVLSLDLANNVISNVFESPLIPVVGNPLYGQISTTLNAANLNSKVAMLSYHFAPRYGLGYYATATFTRSVVNGVPISAYPLASTGLYGVPANGVQQCSDGGNNVCIPYMKGYANVNYMFTDHTYVGLGVDVEGKNNTYFQPPFAIYDFVARHPLNTTLEAQISVENLLNTNSFDALVRPNAGVPIIGENAAGQYSNYVGSGLVYPLIPVEPRTVRFQLTLHTGKAQP